MAAVTSESAVAMPRERPGAGIVVLDLAAGVEDGDAAGVKAQADVARSTNTAVSRIMTC
jgi:hypothetical protein